MTPLNPSISAIGAEGQSSASSNHGGSAADAVLVNAPHRIGKVVLTVRNLDRVTRFYLDVLGLEVLKEEPGLLQVGVGSSVLLELRHAPHARPQSILKRSLRTASSPEHLTSAGQAFRSWPRSLRPGFTHSIPPVLD